MKIALMNLTACILPTACVGGAVYLIMHDKEGWGWLIFLACVSFGLYRETDGGGKKETKSDD